MTEKLSRSDTDLKKLIDIGKSLGTALDLDELLDKILEYARNLADADAGSIYVVETDETIPEKSVLKSKSAQNASLKSKFKEVVIPMTTKSIAGAAAVLKQIINIDDVRKISKDTPYSYDSSWDNATGYHTISVLAVPMINHTGEVLGVVQLINKKKNPEKLLKSDSDFENEVIPMDQRSTELVETLASQAGIAIENTLLYAEIKHIFKGFVKASVHAIEQRDPTTSGHSFRVAALTKRFAEAVNESLSDKFAKIKFDDENLEEIETAALLHDFGKVGVREEVLVKAKKLYPPVLQMIRSRFDFIKRTIENDHLHRRLMMLDQGSPEPELEILDQASKRALDEINECWRIIRSANEPTILTEGNFKKIEEIAQKSYFDLEGQRQPFLQLDEVSALEIARGSLTDKELEEIRSHAKHTISFLEQIPWGSSLRNVPRYAGAHHEKLDGTGYPYGLTSGEISFPSRMMAIADIFDALTASDRPYKKAVSLERAFAIIDMEAKDNHIDKDLVQLFKEAEVYKVLKNFSQTK